MQRLITCRKGVMLLECTTATTPHTSHNQHQQVAKEDAFRVVTAEPWWQQASPTHDRSPWLTAITLIVCSIADRPVGTLSSSSEYYSTRSKISFAETVLAREATPSLLWPSQYTIYEQSWQFPASRVNMVTSNEHLESTIEPWTILIIDESVITPVFR
jgi:hypothetical protein